MIIYKWHTVDKTHIKRVSLNYNVMEINIVYVYIKQTHDLVYHHSRVNKSN